MSGLQFRFFGGFEILDGRGRPVVIKPRKARALLAYLALHAGAAQSRDKLGALLWADSAKVQARSSLRQALTKIRSALPVATELLHVDNETVALRGPAACVDVISFERLIAVGQPDALIDAVDLYRGDLLDGFDAKAPEFDDWLRTETERLRGHALSALTKLLTCDAASVESDQASYLASRLLALDALNETAHRALMRLYAQQGRHAAAIAQYRLCQDHLRRQLDAAPQPATQALYREIAAQRQERPVEFMPPPAAGDGDKPSIAVLPFVNLGQDPDQNVIADGMTEDVIALLSMVRELFVIARNSTWAYRQRAADVREIGRDLNVRYVLDGTVRAAGGRIRITAQLIDAGTAQQIWAERYDRAVSDIFALEDEVAQGIVGALQPQLLLAEAAFADRKRPADLDAWGCIAKATAKLWDYSRAAIDAAEPLARQAIEIDPEYAPAHAILGNVLAWRSYNGFADEIFGCARSALAHIDRALELDRNDPLVLNAAGSSCVLLGRFLQAVPLLQRAYELNPNAAMTCTSLGLVSAIVDRADEGLALVERAIRLSPKDPNAYLFHADRAMCLYFGAHFEAAMDAAETALRLNPDYSAPRLTLVATLVRLDRLDEARREAEKLRTIAPTAMENVFRARPDGTAWPFLTEAIRKAS